MNRSLTRDIKLSSPKVKNMAFERPTAFSSFFSFFLKSMRKIIAILTSSNVKKHCKFFSFSFFLQYDWKAERRIDFSQISHSFAESSPANKNASSLSLHWCSHFFYTHKKKIFSHSPNEEAACCDTAEMVIVMVSCLEIMAQKTMAAWCQLQRG